MIKKGLKKILKRLFEISRFDLRKRRYGWPSFRGSLDQIKKTGFSPALVIDVGAYIGSFTEKCLAIFPDARYLLIEPLEENETQLKKIARSMRNVEYILAVAAAKSGKTILNVHSDFVGSSLYLENEANLDGIPRRVPVVTLDDLCKTRNIPGPYLIKIDVQGAELDVLSGAKEILGKVEYIILEVSLFQFVKGGPQLFDIIVSMKSLGFVVYDILELNYRYLDNALAQVDLAFVKENSQFRKEHIYATPSQRDKLTTKIIKSTRN
jgi:FkbM family methyltransferase